MKNISSEQISFSVQIRENCLRITFREELTKDEIIFIFSSFLPIEEYKYIKIDLRNVDYIKCNPIKIISYLNRTFKNSNNKVYILVNERKEECNLLDKKVFKVFESEVMFETWEDDEDEDS